MTKIVVLECDSFLHYQVMPSVGGKVEIFEYGDSCPKMGDGQEYSGKRLLCKIPDDYHVVWNFSCESDAGEYYLSYHHCDLGDFPCDGDIHCGDDLLRHLSELEAFE